MGTHGFIKGWANSQRLLGSPIGGAVEQSETEGVWFVEWKQLKATDGTPFAAVAALPPKGAARVCTDSPKPWQERNCLPHPSAAAAPPQLCMKQLYAVKDGYTC